MKEQVDGTLGEPKSRILKEVHKFKGVYMSTGSVFEVIDEVENILKTFRILHFHGDNYKDSKTQINKMQDKLTQIVVSYHDLILELETLSKEDEVNPPNIEKLIKFLKNVNDFQEDFNSLKDHIKKLKLPDTQKKKLKEAFKTSYAQSAQAQHSIKALSIFTQQYNNFLTAIDLPARIKHLEGEWQTLESSFDKTSQDQPIPRIPTNEKEIREDAQMQIKKQKDILEGYGCLMLGVASILLSFTIPIIGLPMIWYLNRDMEKRVQIKEIYELRLQNLDRIEKGIVSIKDSLKILGQDPENISPSLGEEINKKIKIQSTEPQKGSSRSSFALPT